MTPPLNLKGRDKIVMAIIGTIVGVPLIYAATIVVPILLKLAIDTTYLLGILIGLFVTATVLWDSRTAIYYWWANTSRNIRRTVARDNPIGVMDTAIARFRKKLKDVDEHRAVAVAALKRHGSKIVEFRKKSEDAAQLVQTAQRSNQPELVVKRHAVAAQRWHEAAEEMVPMGTKFVEMTEKLNQARELAENSLLDMENDREVKSAKYDLIMSNRGAVEKLKSFFGKNEDLEMINLAAEQFDVVTSEAEADFDLFIQNITPAIEANDLKKQAEADAALNRLTERMMRVGLPPATVEADIIITPERAKAPIRRVS